MHDNCQSDQSECVEIAAVPKQLQPLFENMTRLYPGSGGQSEK